MGKGPDPQTAHGVIVIDKPGGMTSARVVARVKRALGVKKIGHTGTLDPMATGVLPLCVGEGTKIAGYLLAEDKSYEGEFALGIETDTLDAEGEVTRRDLQAAALVGREELLAAMGALVGDIEQVPPMFSALKHEGRRLHQLARKGEVVERKPRSIRVDRFDLLDFSEGRAAFAVSASKGTYVRSLVHEVGQALGCGAHLTALRRTRSGRFGIESAMGLSDIESGAKFVLLDPAEAVGHLAQVLVPASLRAAVADGKRLPWQLLSDDEPPSSPFALLVEDGSGLLAIAEVEDERLRYRRVFNYALTRDA